jgi:hypothetical protein
MDISAKIEFLTSFLNVHQFVLTHIGAFLLLLWCPMGSCLQWMSGEILTGAIMQSLPWGTCRIPGGFCRSPNSLQIPLWRWVQSLCEPLLRLEAVTSPLLSQIIQYIVHCVGDAITPARYEYNSYIVSIVLVLDTLSHPCNLGLVRTEWCYPSSG